MGVGHLAITDDQRNIVIDERYVVSQAVASYGVVPRGPVERLPAIPIALKYFGFVDARTKPASVSGQVAQPSVALAVNHSRDPGVVDVSPTPATNALTSSSATRASPSMSARRTISGVIGGPGWNADHRQPVVSPDVRA